MMEVEAMDEGKNTDNRKPRVGMMFETGESAKSFYGAYARHVGFSIDVCQFNRVIPDGSIEFWDFTCSSEVFKRKNVASCNAMLRIERKDRYWTVTKFVENHSHSLASSKMVKHSRPRTHFAGSKRNGGETSGASNDSYVSMNGKHVESFRKRTLGGDAQYLLNYFQKMQCENHGFYYAIQLDDKNHLTNVFWADSRSRAAYNHFGDAVTFDTTYRTNHYQVPIAPFTGINHHGQTVLFGCALLLDESESSFIWLFRTWLSAMNGQPPVSITTDQDRVIKAAVAHVFPETRHCICKWHILRESQERLAHIYHAYPSLYGNFNSCINSSKTVEDFESTWKSLLDKYGLEGNDWLEAVYNARKQWAPAYFRDTFFADLTSKHGASSFFDGYINQQTTVPLFFKQYGKCLKHSLEKEIEADYETICTEPLLKTPAPMEKQAANSYTKKIFAMFQEELVKTSAYTANKIEDDGVVRKYRVANFQDNREAYTVNVPLDISGAMANCSCRMFEYSGILCRHILTVFTVTNILTLPSHYILKRWTKNVKSSVGTDEDIPDPLGIENITSRFNNLCREAIKLAEEGAVAVETYNAAKDALRESTKRVSDVKKNVAKVTPPTPSTRGNMPQEDNSKMSSSSVFEAVPSWWSWPHSVLPHFSIYDMELPVNGLNHPCIAPAPAPAPVHRDNCPPHSVVLI